MSNYNLQSNESIIMKSVGILHVGLGRVAYSDELILTNLNIVLVSKGAFRNTKNIQTYPINQIKVFNGQAQAILNKQFGGFPQLEIYFKNGQETFGFTSKSEVVRWIDNINQLLNGEAGNIESIGRQAIPGTEFVATTVKDTLDTIKGVFGKKSEKEINAFGGKVSIKCISCGAPIIGIKGHTVSCKYCDAEQSL